jgi:hypothetical protein
MTPSNSLSYWFPKLQSIDVPVPRTKIIKTDVDFGPLLDGEEAGGAHEFLEGIKEEASNFGLPLFLRTGHTSAKHSWKNSCYVETVESLSRSVFELIEYSAMAFPCLPWDEWVLREFLDLDTRFIAFHGDMPINNERRYFIENGEIICRHPYWPSEAFEITRTSTEGWREILAEMNSEEAPELEELTLRVASVFNGGWSVDWAKSKAGVWYAIDMAMAGDSYHWQGCPNERKTWLQEENGNEEIDTV